MVPGSSTGFVLNTAPNNGSVPVPQAPNYTPLGSAPAAPARRKSASEV